MTDKPTAEPDAPFSEEYTKQIYGVIDSMSDPEASIVENLYLDAVRKLTYKTARIAELELQLENAAEGREATRQARIEVEAQLADVRKVVEDWDTHATVPVNFRAALLEILDK